eukprot:m.113754 g.113754  ORF g.113754 m.113754 type:complete len:167 (-) comp12802_c5_seq15:163-663(-)
MGAVSTPFWVLTPAQDFHDGRALGILSSCDNFLDYSTCGPYGADPTSIPVPFWRVSAILYTLAVVLGWLGLLLSIAMCYGFENMLMYGRYGFFLVGALSGVAMVVFFGGLDDAFVIDLCNTSGQYDLGDCSIGWSAGLGIFSCVLALVAPCISCSVTKSEEAPYSD